MSYNNFSHYKAEKPWTVSRISLSLGPGDSRISVDKQSNSLLLKEPVSVHDVVAAFARQVQAIRGLSELSHHDYYVFLEAGKEIPEGTSFIIIPGVMEPLLTLNDGTMVVKGVPI